MDKYCDCNQGRLTCTCKDPVGEVIAEDAAARRPLTVGQRAVLAGTAAHYSAMAETATEMQRLTAERDALQALLNQRDQQVDDLHGLLKKMLMALTRNLSAGRDRIVELGGDCDSVERMLDSDPTVSEVRVALADLALLKKCPHGGQFDIVSGGDKWLVTVTKVAP